MVFDYDQTNVNVNYDASRRLPGETLDLWMEAISESVSGDWIDTIVDLGCGTGRFTGALSEHFSFRTIGIDPSSRMLAMARRNIASRSVGLVQGSGEAIPLRDSAVDLVFLSMVYHHIQDKAAALCEFGRILRDGGLLCVRTSTSDSIDSYPWVRFFPDAREIELARAPSRKEMATLPCTHGFVLEKHTVVHQLFAEDHLQYLEKTGKRGLSSLKAISDVKFEEGMRALAEYCGSRGAQDAVHEDIDLFVYRASHGDRFGGA